MRITQASAHLTREKLAAPFGFKGSTLTELWQVAVLLETDAGVSGGGVGVQSVLWSDPDTFAAFGEEESNRRMLTVTERALDMLRGMEVTTPPEMTGRLAEALLPEAARLTGRGEVPPTFVLNALVGADFALWQLWDRERGDGTFDGIIRAFCPELAAVRQNTLGVIPLLSYFSPDEQIIRLLDDGAALLKIKIGQSASSPQEMVEKDLARLAHIHALAGACRTSYTDCGHPVYYLDANGRYPDRETLEAFLDGAARIGALDRIILLEEPFAPGSETEVRGLPVRVTGDESAHSAQDVTRLTGKMGYGAIALKPIAKTLSVSLEMARQAMRNGAVCFCADLTVPPVILDWNMSMASRLPLLPGMKVGVVESNGPQNYPEWKRLDGLCPVPDAPWRTSEAGVFHLGERFFSDSGILRIPDAYFPDHNP